MNTSNAIKLVLGILVLGVLVFFADRMMHSDSEHRPAEGPAPKKETAQADPAKKPAKKPARKPAKKPAKKPTKAVPAEKPAKKPSAKPPSTAPVPPPAAPPEGLAAEGFAVLTELPKYPQGSYRLDPAQKRRFLVVVMSVPNELLMPTESRYAQLAPVARKVANQIDRQLRRAGKGRPPVPLEQLVPSRERCRHYEANRFSLRLREGPKQGVPAAVRRGRVPHQDRLWADLGGETLTWSEKRNRGGFLRGICLVTHPAEGPGPLWMQGWHDSGAEGRLPFAICTRPNIGGAPRRIVRIAVAWILDDGDCRPPFQIRLDDHAPLSVPDKRLEPDWPPRGDPGADGIGLRVTWDVPDWKNFSYRGEHPMKARCAVLKEFEVGKLRARVGAGFGPKAKDRTDPLYQRFRDSHFKPFEAHLAKVRGFRGTKKAPLKWKGLEYDRVLSQIPQLGTATVMTTVRDGRCVAYWFYGPSGCFQEFLRHLDKAKVQVR